MVAFIKAFTGKAQKVPLPVSSNLRTLSRNYLISMFIIGSALFVTFSTVIYRHYDDSVATNRWAIYNYEVARRSRLVLFDLLNMETGVRGYLLTGKPNFLEPYQQSQKLLPEHIDSLKKFAAIGNAPSNDIARWLERLAPFEQLLAMQVRDQGTMTPDQLGHSLDSQKLQMDSLRSGLEDDIAVKLTQINRQMERGHAEHVRFLWILAIGTVLAILAMLVTTLAILGLIARNKKSIEEAERAEERFRVLMSGLGDGVYDYAPLNRGIYLSEAYRTMLGYTETELPSDLDMVLSLIHPDDHGDVLSNLERYGKREIPQYSMAMRMLHKDGSWRWILSRGIGYWNKEGQLTRIIGTHSDISEQKKHEETLVQLNSELETYTFIASHDLRSPLVNLKGFARELNESIRELTPVIQRIKPNLTDAEREIIVRAVETDIPEAIGFILKSADRMDNLTTAVLDLSRIGRREYARVPVDANEIIRKCIEGQAYEINRKGTVVTVEPLPTIISDPIAIEQIFTNLIDNAVKYLDPSRTGKISISARTAAGDIFFAFADNGRGIAQADLGKVFEIFRRARNTDGVSGQGMGMAFVQATVRKLGGQIWVTSTLGEGTTFHVRLPHITKKEN